jgi:ribonuclease P protein subunit RPR2
MDRRPSLTETGNTDIEKTNSHNKKLYSNGATHAMDTTTKTIAKQRIQTLFTFAEEKFRQEPQLAQRYVNTARKIAMSAKVRLPKRYRRQICKHCKSFMPGKNCRVRTRQKREPHIVITCLKCGKQTRIPLDKKKKGRNNE